MKILNDNELSEQVQIMKLLNKAQDISKQLSKLPIDAEPFKHFNTAIFEMSLSPVDRIGDSVYLTYLKTKQIRTIAEPNPRGWYHVQ